MFSVTALFEVPWNQSLESLPWPKTSPEKPKIHTYKKTTEWSPPSPKMVYIPSRLRSCIIGRSKVSTEAPLKKLYNRKLPSELRNKKVGINIQMETEYGTEEKYAGALVHADEIAILIHPDQLQDMTVILEE